MANYGLLGGLGKALSGFGAIGLKQWSDEQDEARDARKAQMKAKLEMDLMKAKYDFMKQNPRYRQFFTDLSGNRIGVDEYGNEKMVHQATADEASDAKAKREAEIGYKNAQAAAAEARGANVGLEAGLLQAQTRAADARASRDNRYKPADKAAKKDPSVLTPLQWTKAAMSMGGIDVKNFDPNDPDDAAAYAANEEKLRKQGYTRGFQGAGSGSSGLGAFANAPGLGGAGGGLLSTQGIPADDDMQDHGPDDDEDLDDE